MVRYIYTLMLFGLTTMLLGETLKSSVEKTLKKNPQILAEESQKEAYKLYVDEAQGDYLPQIDINAYYEKSKTFNDPDNAARSSADKDGFNAKLKLEQLLWDGGKTSANIRQAEAQRDEQKFKSNNNIEIVVLSVTRAYAQLVQYQELMALTKDMLQTNEDNLLIAKDKESISGEILETHQVSSKLNFVKEKLFEEEALVADKKSTLQRYILEEPKGPFCRPIINEKIMPQSLKEAISQALLKNPRIQEQIEDIKEKRESVAIADSKFLPELTLQLQAELDEDLALPENGRQEEILGRLNLAWNLYNGGTDHATTKKEQLFLLEAKQSLEALTKEVIDEIRTVYQSYQKNKQRIEALEAYIEANENIVHVYKEEFDAGTRTFVDILNAQTELYQSRKSLVNREFALADDYFTLLQNIGILSEVIISSKQQVCQEKEKVVVKKAPKEIEELALLLNEETQNKEVIESSDPIKLFENENGYTIALAVYKNKKYADAFYEKLDFEEKTEKFMYSFGTDEVFYKIIYGSFDSVKEANIRLKEIKKELKNANQPYIDNLKKHIDLYKKYHR